VETILIVDDNAGFRRQIRALLEADGFDVVGESADGKSAILDARSMQPRLMLLDIGLPDLDGFEVVRELHSTNTTGVPGIVLTSSRDASAFGPRLRSSGAVGFIAKDELSGPAIRALVDVP
jgi:DNA-binding NarL/FixJ family response regulator